MVQLKFCSIHFCCCLSLTVLSDLVSSTIAVVTAVTVVTVFAVVVVPAAAAAVAVVAAIGGGTINSMLLISSCYAETLESSFQ